MELENWSGLEKEGQGVAPQEVQLEYIYWGPVSRTEVLENDDVEG